jgi:hypothetical protein
MMVLSPAAMETMTQPVYAVGRSMSNLVMLVFPVSRC